MEGESVADTTFTTSKAQVGSTRRDRRDDGDVGEEFVEGVHDGVVKRARGGGDGAGFGDEVGDLHLVGKVAERFPQQIVDLFLRLARQGPDVELHPGDGRQHVDRLAGTQHGGGDGEVAHGVGVALQLTERLVAFAAQQGRFGVGVEFPGADVALPDVVATHFGRDGGDAAGDLADLGDRHVAAEGCGAVAGVAMHGQAALCGALLADDDHERVGAVGHRQVGAALLGQAVRPGERRVFGEPRRAEATAGLLVGASHEGQGAFRAHTGQGNVAHSRRHRCSDVEHVGGAAPVHAAVFDLTPERVNCPFILVDGHDIGVAQKGEWLSVGVGAFDGKRYGNSTRMGFEAFDVYTGIPEEFLQRAGVSFLVSRICR